MVDAGQGSLGRVRLPDYDIAQKGSLVNINGHLPVSELDLIGFVWYHWSVVWWSNHSCLIIHSAPLTRRYPSV